VGVGIASTKTLAKLANHIATKPPEYAGVGVWEDLPKQARDRILKQLPVSEVWGIGASSASSFRK
jgi:DNA polymerase V